MQIFNSAKSRKGQQGRQSKYDISFRRKIAKEYLEGSLTMVQIAARYGLKRHNVMDWIRKFSSDLAAKQEVIPVMTPEEQQEMEALKRQLSAVKQQLDYEQMKNFALETMIDLAKEELGVDIRKNSGAKQPKK